MAFCPRCGNEIDAGSESCAICNGAARPFPQLPGYPTAQPAAAYAAASHQTASPPFIPLHGYGSPSASSPPGPHGPGTLRTVIWTVASVVAVIVALGFLLAGPVEKSLADHIGKEAMRTGGNMAAITQMVDILKGDAALLQFLSSTSDQMTGTLDERLDKKAQLIRDYVAAAEKIDVNSCPAEFANAYRQHLFSWSLLAAMYSSHPHIPSEAESFVRGILQNLTGDSSAAAIQQQDITEWAAHVEVAQKEADQGTRDFMAAGKKAIDAVGTENGSVK